MAICHKVKLVMLFRVFENSHTFYINTFYNENLTMTMDHERTS